ncbi:MAG: class I SAM-dependent methyltransferase [Phycisphaerales bacterium]
MGASDRGGTNGRSGGGVLPGLIRRVLPGGGGSRKPAYVGREAEYWDERFASQPGALRGPGHSALDEDANVANYEEKRAFLARHLPRWAPARRPNGSAARLLDAGCGPGAFLGTWLELGYEVSGLDFSPSAIESARVRHGDRVSLHVGRLEGTAPGAAYDIVVCVDVLFHVVSDDAWQSAVGMLARSCARDGVLVIQEGLDQPMRPSRHVRGRTRAEYARAFESAGMFIDEHHRHYLAIEGALKDVLVLRHRGEGLRGDGGDRNGR